MLKLFGALVLALLLSAPRADARRASSATDLAPVIETPYGTSDLPRSRRDGLAARAPGETTWLYSATFDAGGACTPQSWTAVDMTTTAGDFFHVDDYAGLSFGPIQGAKSLWCGARPSGDFVFCQYATLPGYGNSWDQAWCTKACIAVSGALDVSMLMRLDSEPGYDATLLEYMACPSGEWTPLDGGVAFWDGATTLAVDSAYSAGAATSVRVRLRFVSDGAYSDQDGLYNSNGALHVDSLQVEGLAVEDFEDEAVGAKASNDWQSCVEPGYGITALLLPGSNLLQEDPCVRDLSCMWAFLAGSTVNYACGGFPAQTAVPFGNADGEYMNNDIWSPLIPVTGTGAGLVLEFSVYRDLPLDNLVFYNWRVRAVVNGCPTAWKRRTSTYYGAQKDWFRSVQSIGDLVNLSTASHIQVGLSAFDMCIWWCDVYGSGACHSHAPLFDNVEVYRVNCTGPQWIVSDQSLFQDSFANDGTLTGTVRADMARDILVASNPSILPGDSAVVTVSDPAAGLAPDPGDGTKKAVYAWVSVWPQGQPAKTGAGLSGGARWPATGTQVINGVTWTALRFDQAYTSGGSPVSNTYCVDLNDALFTPGDTICFFFAAKSNDVAGSITYYARDIGTVDDITVAAANPMEFTCLPAGGYHHGGEILYVDGMDGRGAQPYWDTAFQALGIERHVDRYDVRAPSSGVENRPGSRVYDVLSQLNAVYRVILWDCGDLSITLGDGSRTPEKTDDYGMINLFLGGMTDPGGVYIGGDDVAEQLAAYSSPSAVTFTSTYLNHVLVSGDHRPAYGVAPPGVRDPQVTCFDDDFLVFGGCPLLNDFDVMQTAGSAQAVFTYGAPAGNNAAAVLQVTNNGLTGAGALLSGFAFQNVADDENDGISDRAAYLGGVLCTLGAFVMPPTGTGPELENHLSQNYPNPFNPQTTIAFSIRSRGAVSVKVYNVGGERVRTLVDEERAAGSHAVVWDGRNSAGSPVSSGVYFYRLETPGFQQTRKMVLLK